jgi:hypothetical protein
VVENGAFEFNFDYVYMTLVTDYMVAVSLKNLYINCPKSFIVLFSPFALGTQRLLGNITSDITSDMVGQLEQGHYH